MTQPTNRNTGITPEYQRDWPLYFDAVAGKPPRDTSLRALKTFAAEPYRERTAIDLGCGEGRDTRAILASSSWRVFATDANSDAVARTQKGLSNADLARCTILQIPMDALPLDPRVPARVDFVNASFALPFCDPSHFPALWSWITTVLSPGGRFAGQFFGDRDEWCPIRPASHVTRAQLESLLAPFAIEYLDEVEKRGDDAMGGTKYHHVFHVVARRNP